MLKGVLAGVLVTVLAACSGAKSVDQEIACAEGLDTAFSELDQAKSKGLSGAVSITKATSLLTAAKIQQQFEKYPNCIDKVNRARRYIRSATRQ